MNNNGRVGRLIERRFSKFLSNPLSIRGAAAAIVTATTVVVVAGAILVRFLDHREFGNIWLGLWWSVQTVTTVGYGDVTPKDVIGRIVGVFVMLEGIAFVTIATAAVTSIFIARAQVERELQEAKTGAQPLESLAASYAELVTRLESLETSVTDLTRTVAAKQQ